MTRYLVKMTGETLDYITIPKVVPLEWNKGSVRVVLPGGGRSVWHRGYTLVEAKSPKEAFWKAFKVDVSWRRR